MRLHQKGNGLCGTRVTNRVKSQDGHDKKKVLEKRGTANLLSGWKYSYPFAFQDADSILEGIVCKTKWATLHSLRKQAFTELKCSDNTVQELK
jgi:hypothetical protein